MTLQMVFDKKLFMENYSTNNIDYLSRDNEGLDLLIRLRYTQYPNYNLFKYTTVQRLLIILNINY